MIILFLHEHLESEKQVMLIVLGQPLFIAWRALISWLELDFFCSVLFRFSFSKATDTWTTLELPQFYSDSSIVSFDTVCLNMLPDSAVILAGVSHLIAQYLPVRLYWAPCLDTFSCSGNSRWKDKNDEVCFINIEAYRVQTVIDVPICNPPKTLSTDSMQFKTLSGVPLEIKSDRTS